jgi:hypothetical protein
VFEVVELGAELVVIFVVLTEFEEFGLELRDDEIFLVRFDLGGVVVLGMMRDREEGYLFVGAH